MATLTATISLRRDLLRALTNDEVDDNFQGLNTDSIAINTDLENVKDVTIPAVQNYLEGLIELRQPINSRLTYISTADTTGLLALTNVTTGEVINRELTSDSPLLTIANPRGIADNPIFDLSPDILTNNSVHTVTNKDINGNNNTITNVSLISAVKDLLPISSGGTNAANAADARANLNVLVQPSSNGIAVRTAEGESAAREITVSGSGLTITNGSGVGGNPLLTLESDSANTANKIVVRDSSGNFAAGAISAVTLNASKSIELPDQNAVNLTPVPGSIRYNSNYMKFEGYTDHWKYIDTYGAAVGGNDDQVFFENQTTVNYDWELSPGRNAMSVGPITIAPGVTVSIPAGQRWVIL